MESSAATEVEPDEEAVDDAGPSTAGWEAIINRVVAGDPEARYQLYVRDVVKQLSWYRPAQLEFPAVLAGVTVEQLKAAAALEDAISDDGKLTLAAFCQFRRDVIAGEVRTEKQLLALGWALEEIRRGGRAQDPQVKADYWQVVRHLKARFQLEPPTPAEPVRIWARQKARRYDLLPGAYREL